MVVAIITSGAKSCLSHLFLGLIFQATSPSFVALRSQEIVNKVTGRGLVISYRFTRSPHLFSPKMSSIELTFSNQGHEEISDMKMGPKVGL